MNKAIHYFSLAANQNHPEAQYNLGFIYYECKYITRDINKSIYYLKLASNQGDERAQFLLGFIYYEGIDVPVDINKAIYYFKLAVKQNYAPAYYILGYYILWKFAHFLVGFLYHEGKYVKRDIHKSIKKYKDASTFNNQYTKNNLGMLYRNGILNEFSPNIGISMSYFEENIKQVNDCISMYNLSRIYIYYDRNTQRISKVIELLIQSISMDFIPSKKIIVYCFN